MIIKNNVMSKGIKILEKLNEYLENASEEQLEKDWEYLKQFNEGGPEMEDILKKALTRKRGKNKFKVGDWIAIGDNPDPTDVFLIVGVYPAKDEYRILSFKGNESMDGIDMVDENFRLWTLDDARVGTVLCDSDGAPFIYSGEAKNGNPCSYGGMIDRLHFRASMGVNVWTTQKCHPATKEKCDHLYKAMKREGYKWDSDLDELVRVKKWMDDEDSTLEGFWIGSNSGILETTRCENSPANYNVFAAKEQAKSALAMARISQILANDERFGGVVTDDEWNESEPRKIVIVRKRDEIHLDYSYTTYGFLAFHTLEQCELFLEEHESLIKDYFMLNNKDSNETKTLH